MNGGKKTGAAGKILLAVLGAFLLCVLAAALGLAVRNSNYSRQMQSVEEAFASGDYDSIPAIVQSTKNNALRRAVLDRCLSNAESAAENGNIDAALSLCTVLDKCRTDKKVSAGIKRSLADNLRKAGKLEQAKSIYELIGDGESREKIRLCDYEAAKNAFSQEDYLTAKSMFEALGSYSDSADMAELCRDELYSRATRSMYECRFEEAMYLFLDLPDYLDAEDKAAYCEKRMKLQPSAQYKKPNSMAVESEQFPGGVLYVDSLGLLYVPDEINADTRSFVYFPGGVGENYLYTTGIWEYFSLYSPNAVMYFFYTSGFFSMRVWTDYAMDLLEQVAVYKGFVVHDMVTAGSSHGCYTAIKSAALLYQHYNQPVRSVVSLDAGEDFRLQTTEEYLFLNDAEYRALAEAGTVMLLFEEPGVSGNNNHYISVMRKHGTPVYVIECRDATHNNISANAYGNGVFSWALDELPAIDPEEYNIIMIP